MDWNQVEGRWKRYRGNFLVRWGKLTQNDAAVFRGKRKQLLGTIQERYAIADKHAEAQVDDFARSLYSARCQEDARSGPDREHRRGASKS